jgi:hypothetical protein
MVTKAASLADSASGRTVGNADHKRATFDVNHRLTDTIASASTDVAGRGLPAATCSGTRRIAAPSSVSAADARHGV